MQVPEILTAVSILVLNASTAMRQLIMDGEIQSPEEQVLESSCNYVLSLLPNYKPLPEKSHPPTFYSLPVGTKFRGLSDADDRTLMKINRIGGYEAVVITPSSIAGLLLTVHDTLKVVVP